MSLTSSLGSLIKADIESIVSGGARQTGDISGLNLGKSVSSDKMFSSVSSSKKTSNVFGVFDVKQAVRELSGNNSSAFSTETVSKLNQKKLSNMNSKVGVVRSDLQFNAAVVSVMNQMIGIRQLPFTYPVPMIGSAATITAYRTPVRSYDIGNISQNPQVSSFVPNRMSVNDYNSLKTLFNTTGGLHNYNTCDTLAGILDYSKHLLDPNALWSSLLSLFGLIAKYDLGGILQCISQAQRSIGVRNRYNLANTLIGGGAIIGFSDLIGSSNHAVILNRYDAIQQLGSNREVDYDPYTHQPINRFDEGSDTRTTTDTIMSSFGISDKSRVYSANAYNDTHNDSVMDGISDNVYDRSAILNTKNDNGFTDYCFDGNGDDRLISSVPDSLFA